MMLHELAINGRLFMTAWIVHSLLSLKCLHFIIIIIFYFQTSKNQIKVDLVDENFTELKGEIAGPPDTPYEGERLPTAGK